MLWDNNRKEYYTKLGITAYWVKKSSALKAAYRVELQIGVEPNLVIIEFNLPEPGNFLDDKTVPVIWGMYPLIWHNEFNPRTQTYKSKYTYAHTP